MAKQMFAPDYYTIPEVVRSGKGVTPIAGYVYAVIYWAYFNLRDRKCTFRDETIAEILGCGPRSVSNSLTILEKCGFVRRVYNGKIREMIPLIVYGPLPDLGKTTSRFREVPLPDLGNREDTCIEDTCIEVAPASPDAPGIDLKSGKKEWTPGELTAYLKSMSDNPRKGVQITVLYWGHKGVGVNRGAFRFKNKSEAEFELRRSLRPANRLAQFDLRSLEERMEVFAEYANFDWTLETVEKYITRSNEDLVKILKDLAKKK